MKQLTILIAMLAVFSTPLFATEKCTDKYFVELLEYLSMTQMALFGKMRSLEYKLKAANKDGGKSDLPGMSDLKLVINDGDRVKIISEKIKVAVEKQKTEFRVMFVEKKKFTQNRFIYFHKRIIDWMQEVKGQIENHCVEVVARREESKKTGYASNTGTKQTMVMNHIR